MGIKLGYLSSILVGLRFVIAPLLVVDPLDHQTSLRLNLLLDTEEVSEDYLDYLGGFE